MKEENKNKKWIYGLVTLALCSIIYSIAFNIGFMFGAYQIATSELSLKNNAEIELMRSQAFNNSVEYIYINNTPSCELEILKAETRMFNEYLEKGYLQKVELR